MHSMNPKFGFTSWGNKKDGKIYTLKKRYTYFKNLFFSNNSDSLNFEKLEFSFDNRNFQIENALLEFNLFNLVKSVMKIVKYN